MQGHVLNSGHVEKALCIWYCEARTHNIPLSDLILITKAQQIGEILKK